MIAVSRLLKSCAMPPASRPTASIFCEWRSCSSRTSRFVSASSRSAMIAASSRPLSEPSARNENSRNCVNSTGKAENGPMPLPAIAIANAAISATIVVGAARAESQARPADDREEDERDRHVAGREDAPQPEHQLRCREQRQQSSAMPSATRGHVHSIGRPLTQAKTAARSPSRRASRAATTA